FGAEAPAVVAADGLRGAEPVAEGIDVTRAEVAFAVRGEGALDAGDVLDRRTRIGLVAKDRDAAADAVAHSVAETLSAFSQLSRKEEKPGRIEFGSRVFLLWVRLRSYGCACASEVDHVAREAVEALLQRLRQRRVGVHVTGQLQRREVPLLRERQLGQKLGDVR